MLQNMSARHDKPLAAINNNACTLGLAICRSIRGVWELVRLRIDIYMFYGSMFFSRNAYHAWYDLSDEGSECRRRRCFSGGTWELSPTCRRESMKEQQRGYKAHGAIATSAACLHCRTYPDIQECREGLVCHSRHRRHYFFILTINSAISWASLRLSGKFGIVACGRSRNDAIMSASIVGLAAIDANDGALLNLSEAEPIA